MIALRRSRGWYKFSRNPLSVVGLALVVAIALVTVFAPLLAPHPEHAGMVVDFHNINAMPDAANLMGTDEMGRDILSRLLIGYRASLGMGVVVLAVAVPIGVILGLFAGYYGGAVETIIMRLTDVFLALPPLVLAMAIMGFLEPTLINVMVAICVMWWPWHARLIYNLTRSLRTEDYVVAAKVVGASDLHIMFREILPNCVPSLLTKITFDMAFVILLIAALGFIGLGVQPPTPDLGRMVSDGMKFVPQDWWIAVFPGFGIMIAVLGFSLLGDGLRDLLDVEV